MNNVQMANKYVPDSLVIPGEVLEEYLECAGLTQASLADRTGLSKKTINEIVKAKSAITAETALRFERTLGRPAHFWSNLERQYQEDKTRLADKIRLGKTLLPTQLDKVLDTNIEKKLNFIDLFAGCGGLSLGLINAGLHGILAIEKSPDAFDTFQHNLINGDKVEQFSWPSWLPCEAMPLSALLKKYSSYLNKLTDKVDLIVGGPPCQGFSFAGKRDPTDPRNKLTGEYIKVIEIIRPRFLLIENVKGYKAAFSNKSRNKIYADIVKTKLEDLGYIVHMFMIDASIFGVPQCRHRFVMIAFDKNKINFDGNPKEILLSMTRTFRKSKGLPETGIISVSNAISNLETQAGKYTEESSENKEYRQIKYRRKSNSKYQKLMQTNCPDDYIPNGLRLTRHRKEIVKRFKTILRTCEKGKEVSKERLEKFGTHKISFTPLHPRKLSRTITTLPDDLLHYSEPRILTVRENARLQSFPDWFEILGKYTTGGNRRKKECPKYTQIGNAVPPLLAEALGMLIIKMSEAK